MQVCFTQVDSYGRRRLGPEIYKQEICRDLPSVKKCVREAKGKSDDRDLDQEIYGWITSKLTAFDRSCGEVVSEKTKTVKRWKENSKECKEVQKCVDKFEQYRESLNNKTITKALCRKFRAHKKCVKKAASNCKNKTLINKAKEDIKSAKNSV
ncbi:uncharacterized protein LOC131950910 [Physella acuta]|uniref:uncharacterized protein LOC131950910 n=1 Tax=Physella acuta TaxID=109671 RepID=UPI0027DD45D2|nr:uncharacterized protein LOC131950910 [Physella acuta]